MLDNGLLRSWYVVKQWRKARAEKQGWSFQESGFRQGHSSLGAARATTVSTTTRGVLAASGDWGGRTRKQVRIGCWKTNRTPFYSNVVHLPTPTAAALIKTNAPTETRPTWHAA